MNNLCDNMRRISIEEDQLKQQPGNNFDQLLGLRQEQKLSIDFKMSEGYVADDKSRESVVSNFSQFLIGNEAGGRNRRGADRLPSMNFNKESVLSSNNSVVGNDRISREDFQQIYKMSYFMKSRQSNADAQMSNGSTTNPMQFNLAPLDSRQTAVGFSVNENYFEKLF